MTDERLSELKKQVAALTYVPTRSAGLELIAEIEHLRAELEAVRLAGDAMYDAIEAVHTSAHIDAFADGALYVAAGIWSATAAGEKE